MSGFSLLANQRSVIKKATFRSLYSELALHKAALKVYTKPLFFWRKALQRSHDGLTLYDFARNTAKNLEQLNLALRNQTFHFREGLEIQYRIHSKRRTIYLFPWEERMVDLLLYQILNRYFHSTFSKNSYAYRYRGFGIDVCQHRVARHLAGLGKPLYFLKRDIANYFPSVDHEILLDQLIQWIKPGDYLFELLQERVRFQFYRQKEKIVAHRGIPFGTATACFFANVYLTSLDAEMENIDGLHYFRYADDILAFSTEREAIAEADQTFERMLTKLKLASKLKHHHNFYFGENGISDESFERVRKFRHLGLEFREYGSIGLSRDKARKICNLFKFAFRRAHRKFRTAKEPAHRAKLAIHLVRDLIEHGFRTILIIDYYLKHVDDEEQLRLIDRWLAEEVLSLVFKNGHCKGNFRKLSFRQLRKWGLPSLRHRRRLLRHGHLKSSFFVLRTEKLIEQQRGRLPLRSSNNGTEFLPRPAAAAIKTREEESRLSMGIIEE